MAGNDALLASLLLGQKQRRDPLEIYQSFGRSQTQAGSSPAPLGSGNALEGIARALQGGIGGLMQGYAMNKQEEQDTATSEGLQRAALAKTPEEYAEAMKGVRGSEGNAQLGQIASSRLAELLMQRQAGNKLGPLMGNGPAAPGAPPVMQQGGGFAPQGGIDTAALAPPGAGQPGSFANNSGNIRSTAPGNVNGFATYATPQDGATAHFANYQAYVRQNPNITVAQALAKWSPPNENNTGGIITQISEATGINPGKPLAEVLQDPAEAARLLDAQTRLEKGGLPQGFSADTFMAAAGDRPAPGQAAPGAPGPIAQAPAQGSGPQPTAPQGPPTAMSSPAGDQMRQRAQAAQQAGDNVTALKYAQEAAAEDAKWSSEVGKRNLESTEWDRRAEATTQAKTAADAQARAQPSTVEMQKLRDARAEGASIIAALNDYKTEFEKGPGFRSMLGVSTPANTSYNNATMLMKGEALYNLGVLSGPDLDIIRRILPDPSTFAGQKTTKEEMNTAVGKVTNLINTRIAEKERNLGVSPAPEATAALPPAGGPPPPPPGFRSIP